MLQGTPQPKFNVQTLICRYVLQPLATAAQRWKPPSTAQRRAAKSGVVARSLQDVGLALYGSAAGEDGALAGLPVI